MITVFKILVAPVEDKGISRLLARSLPTIEFFLWQRTISGSILEFDIRQSGI